MERPQYPDQKSTGMDEILARRLGIARGFAERLLGSNVDLLYIQGLDKMPETLHDKPPEAL